MFMTSSISFAVILAIVALLAFAIAVTYGRWRGVVRSGYWAALVSLRILSVVAVLMLIMQPASKRQQPDPEHFRVAIIADLSGSMTTVDCQGQSRLAMVEQVLGPEPGAWMQAIRQNYNTQVYGFSDELRPLLPGMPIRVQGGNTAIGEALRQCLQLNAEMPLGAVVLLSDGRSNSGVSPTSVARTFQQRGIPISTVGIGEAGGGAGDVSVQFLSNEITLDKDQSRTVALQVRNTLPQVVVNIVDVTLANRLIFSRQLTLAPGAETVIEVPIQPWRAGFLSCRASLRTPVAGDTRPETDVDYLGVRVDEPRHFRILYLSGHLNWEYRALRQALADSQQLHLAAVIRTAERVFFIQDAAGGDDQDPSAPVLTALPQTAADFNAYDAILLDTELLTEFSSDTVAALAAFVERRGGGLLLVGPVTALPEPLLPLLPSRSPPSGQQFQRDQVLQASRSFIFERDPAQVLASPPQLLAVAGDPLWPMPRLKAGARAALSLAGSDDALLAAQIYGSGRSAYLGYSQSWRWRLGSSGGLQQHSQFWRELLFWLAASNRQRLQLLFDGSKISRDQVETLALDVLDTEYRPALQVQGRLVLTSPAGTTEIVELSPHPRLLGRYIAGFHPQQAGEYRIDAEVTLAEQTLQQQGYLLVAASGSEFADPSYDEKTLRDIARISGGSFRHYRSLNETTPLPLSADLAVTTAIRYWCSNAAMLLLLLATMLSSWYLRRRIGLK